MKKIYRKSNAFLLALLAGAICFVALACSSHINDAKDAADASKDANVGIEANIEVDFATLVLAYDSTTGLAQVSGLTDATYAWYIDTSADAETSAITGNGAWCLVIPSYLTTGNHTLTVVATVSGIEYSESCTITVE